MSDIVTATVNGVDYGGWKSVRIQSGIERAARDFELSVTDHWPGSAEQTRRIKPGDLCEIRIGGELICTGYVDSTPIDYDGNGINVVIRGRSKTGDLVDCSADNTPGQFRGLSVETIASNLCAPYGVNVVAEAATGNAITEHQIQQGETVFESLERLAKLRQVMVTDNASGDLVITAPGGGGNASSALELGVNILSASAGFDYSEVYSDYSVKGQRSGTDDNFGASVSQITGSATDKNIKRKRFLLVRQSGQADSDSARQRASYEQQIRSAKAGEIRYKVAGWRQADGSLWRPNISVKITDNIMGVSSILLVSEVIYSLDESGMIAELVVIPPGAFATEPQTKAAAKARQKSTVQIDSWLD